MEKIETGLDFVGSVVNFKSNSALKRRSISDQNKLKLSPDK